MRDLLSDLNNYASPANFFGQPCTYILNCLVTMSQKRMCLVVITMFSFD